MSVQLKAQAPAQASFLYNARRQFVHVPPMPDAIDLVGKTVLVTGSNNGLGLECVRHFLKLRPSLLIMGVRSVEKGEAAASSLRAEFPEARIEVWRLDMESFRSVQDFVARIEREIDRLHVVVLNAALAKERFEPVEEGGRRETTIQVNYLSTALLAILLVPKMKQSTSSPGPGRLSIVGSDSALALKLDGPDDRGILDSLNQPESYDGFQQYAKSKLLITMFVARLAEAIDPDDVIINTCNPGATKGTGLLGDAESWIIKLIFSLLFSLVGRTAKHASWIYLHASLVLGKASHGSFTDWAIRPWPTIMYTDYGRGLSDKLWNETMDELSFAGIDQVMNGIKRADGPIVSAKK